MCVLFHEIAEFEPQIRPNSNLWQPEKEKSLFIDVKVISTEVPKNYWTF